MHCVQKANALTLLVQKADTLACIIRTQFVRGRVAFGTACALTCIVRTGNALPGCVLSV